MEKVCDTCKFYNLCKCYRFPPFYFEASGGMIAAYPNVYDPKRDWCGEWQPKEREYTDKDFAFIKENLDGLLDEYENWKSTGISVSEFVDMKLDENHERNKKKENNCDVD